MHYIPIPNINKKLHQAARAGEVLYIHAPIGLGKTAAVRNYLKRRKAVWFNGEPGYLENMPSEEELGDAVAVIDGISCIRDYTSMEYISELIRRQDRQCILIGRGILPSWLAVVSTEVTFRFAGPQDLLLDQESLTDAFSKTPWNLTRETMERIFAEAKQNPMFAAMIADRAVNGRLTDDDVERARLNYYHVLDDRFYSWLDKEEQTVLIALCSFDHFSLEMARRVTGNPLLEAIFERIFLLDACLERKGDEYYIVEPYRSYLFWKQAMVLEPPRRRDIYRMAAIYYSLQDDPFTVIECYRKAGDYARVDETILRICDNYELVERNLRRVTDCMNVLTAEQSYNSPLIMTSRSLLYSLEMNPGRAEDWYERLTEYAARKDLNRSERIEAAFRISYLDLFLPHRSSNGLLERLGTYLEAKKKWNGPAGHPSLTLYGPSAINGLFDLSRLIEENSESGQAQAAILEAGRKINSADAGFVELVQQELALERGEADETTFETRLNQILLDAERRGMTDRCMTAVVQYAKGRLVKGDTDGTKLIHKGFTKRYEKDPFALRELRGLEIWISLLNGENGVAEKWFTEAPDSREFFALADRYSYILKARIEIMKGDFQLAQILLTRLAEVFEEYHRDYMLIMVNLLVAVALYRSGSSRWKNRFLEALQRAERFRYVRVIADEGVAAVPLFDGLTEEERAGFNEQWLDKVEKAVRQMAGYYPNYLRTENQEEDILTAAEKKVLRMLCQELNSGEICEQLHISYSGLKYHKRNIYRKLGVRSRNEAQKMARNMKMDN